MKLRINWKALWEALKPVLLAAVGGGVVTLADGCSSLTPSAKTQSMSLYAIGIPPPTTRATTRTGRRRRIRCRSTRGSSERPPSPDGSGGVPRRVGPPPYTGGLTSLHDLFGFPTRNRRLPSAGAEGSTREPVAEPTCLPHAKYAKFAKQPKRRNFAHFANLA